MVFFFVSFKVESLATFTYSCFVRIRAMCPAMHIRDRLGSFVAMWAQLGLFMLFQVHPCPSMSCDPLCPSVRSFMPFQVHTCPSIPSYHLRPFMLNHDLVSLSMRICIKRPSPSTYADSSLISVCPCTMIICTHSRPLVPTYARCAHSCPHSFCFFTTLVNCLDCRHETS